MNSTLRLLAIPALMVGVLFVLSLLFIKPWFDDVLTQRKLIDAREAEVSVLLQKLEQLVRLEEDDLRQYLVELELTVPASASAPYVLAALERLVQEQGMIVDSIQYKGVSGLSQVQESVVVETETGGAPPPIPGASVPGQEDTALVSGQVDVQLNTRGEYYQIADFFQELGRSRPLIAGTDFSIRRQDVVQESSDDTSVVTVSFLLNFEAYAPFQEIPTDLGAATAKVVPLKSPELELIEQVSDYRPLFEIAPGVDGDAATPSFSTGRANPF